MSLPVRLQTSETPEPNLWNLQSVDTPIETFETDLPNLRNFPNLENMQNHSGTRRNPSRNLRNLRNGTPDPGTPSLRPGSDNRFRLNIGNPTSLTPQPERTSALTL